MLHIARHTLDQIQDAGRITLPRETGGIVLGFRVPEAIVVTRAIPVSDPDSSGHRYTRQRRRAQHLMRSITAETPSVVGYVGEWHTHPANAAPSRTDRQTLASIARVAAGPVGLLVLAYPNRGPARLHGLIARTRPTLLPPFRIVDVLETTVQIVEDTPDSIEHQAMLAQLPTEES